MKTTSLRTRALACALLPATAFCGLTAQPAAAQTTPPAYRHFDANGVDLVRGDYLLSFVEGSIGSGEAELPLVRTVGSAAGGASQWDGILFQLTRPHAGGPETATVTMASKAETFTASGGGFSSSLALGSTLTGGGSAFTYTMRDGTMIGFSDPTGNSWSGATNFCKGNSQTSCSLLPTLIASPDGKAVDAGWTTVETCSTLFNPDGSLDCEYAWRLAGVANSFGYSIGFDYSDNSTAYPPAAGWYRRSGAGFYNNRASSSPLASVSYSYPSNGVTDVTDAGGRTWRVGPGAIRRPGAGSDTIVVSTNTSGTVGSVTRDGVVTHYSRAVSGNMATMTVTQTLGQQSLATEIVSDLTIGRPISIRDPLDRTTRFAYDSHGRLERTTAPEGNYLAHAYDARGNVIRTEAVPKGGTGPTIVSSATYDETCSNPVTCNRPGSITDARGATTSYAYHPAHGGVEAVTEPAPASDAAQPRTRYTYTLINDVYRLTGVSRCQATSSCANGADEVRTAIAYDSNGNVVATSTGSGDGALTATTATTYDAIGNMLTVDGPLAGADDTTRIRYNAAREVVGTISPDPDPGSGPGQASGPLKPRAVRNTWTNGLLTKVEQGNVAGPSDGDWAAFSPAQAVETDYDVHARPVTGKLTAGGTTHALTQTSYDPLGRIDCVVRRMDIADFGSSLPDACTLTAPDGADGPDRIVRTSYDEVGRVVKVTAALGTADQADEATTTYTPNGLVATVTDGENNRTTWEYDGHDRLLRTRFPDTAKGAGTSSTTDYEELAYESLAGGTRTSDLVAAFRNRAGETIGFGYDALGRMVSKDLPGSELDVAYGYDLLGRMISASTSAQTLTFAWDALGRNLSQADGSRTYSSQYDLAGRRTRLTHPDGFFVEQDYLVTGEMTVIRENGATSGVGVLATYGYDDLGRRTSLVFGNGESASYSYDSVSRLSQFIRDLGGSATANDLILTFAYNPASQIVSTTRSNDLYAWTGHGSGSATSSFDGLNRLTSQQNASGTTSFSHDARGNRLNDEARTYVYDSENKSLGVAAFPWHYDPLGRLSGASTSPGTPPAIAYESYVDNLIAERTPGSSTVQRRHVFGPGTDEPLVWYEGSDRRFLHADERGSIVAVTNDTGGLLAINRYDEYGRTETTSTTYMGRFLYTGQRYFGGFGLYHYKSRMYDPRTGRFMQPDPSGYGDGLNLYVYVGGDPVNLVDPSGTEAEDVESIISTGIPVRPARPGGERVWDWMGIYGRAAGGRLEAMRYERRLGPMKDTSNNPNKGDPKNVQLASLADCAQGMCGLIHPASVWLGDHDYISGPNVICPAAWRCSAALVGSVYAQVRFAVPGSSGTALIVSGGTYTVRLGGVPVGTVTSYVGAGGLTINNVTNLSHILYNGWANRNAYQVPNGTWYSYTHGKGTNYFGGVPMAGANEIFGPGVFDGLDRAIYRELYLRTR